MAARIEAPPVNQALGRQLVIGADAQQRDLSGDEKAAVLLLSLGPDFGRPILEELDEMEIKILSRTMVRMGAVTQDMVDSLYAEFVTSISANGSVAGNSDTTQRLLMSFLPAERVDAIMRSIRTTESGTIPITNRSSTAARRSSSTATSATQRPRDPRR